LYWLVPTPFALPRFRSVPAGFRFPIVDVGFEPAATPLFRLPFSSKLYIYPTTAPECAFESTSREVLSPTALDRIRRPVNPADPPAGTFRPQGFSPSRRLAPPETMQGLFHPRCALGVLSDLGTSHGPFSPAGVTRPSLLFTAFSSPATDTCWRALPSCVPPCSAAAPFRGTT
jgi:hypothetical protein